MTCVAGVMYQPYSTAPLAPAPYLPPSSAPATYLPPLTATSPPQPHYQEQPLPLKREPVEMVSRHFKVTTDEKLLKLLYALFELSPVRFIDILDQTYSDQTIE